MTIGYRQGVSVAVLIFYIPALAVAIFLSIRHGFSRASGWRFMIVFTLARVLGSCFELATISQPRNYSLYIGYATLINIALSPLEMVGFGLLSRVITVSFSPLLYPLTRAYTLARKAPTDIFLPLLQSINRSMSTAVTPRHMKLAETLIGVGLILSIIGGINAGTDYGNTGVYKPQSLSKVGLALFIAAFAILTATTAILSKSVQYAERGERRILLAVAASLPLLLVRLIFSALAVFANNGHFSLLYGSVTVLLFMALLEEAVVVIIYEGVGLTLRKQEKVEVAQAQRASGEELMDGEREGERVELKEREESSGPIRWIAGRAYRHGFTVAHVAGS